MGAIHGQPDAAAFLSQFFSQPDPDPVTPPVGNNHRVAGVGFTFKDLPGFNDMGVDVDFRIRLKRCRSSCDDHRIRTCLLHQCHIHVRVQANLNSSQLHLASQVIHQNTKFRPTRQGLRK